MSTFTSDDKERLSRLETQFELLKKSHKKIKQTLVRVSCIFLIVTLVLFIQGLALKEQASDFTPQSGYGELFCKTDGKLYFKNDAGTTVELTAGGGDHSVGTVSVKSENTVYQAATDGLVIAYGNPAHTTTDHYMTGLTDSGNPPTTVLAYAGGEEKDTTSQGYYSLTFPVKSGDYWELQATATVDDVNVNWVPLGN